MLHPELAPNITPINLSSLDIKQLHDLFHHRSSLTSIAAITGLKDTEYLNTLRNKIQWILAEIENRKNTTVEEN